MATAAVVLTACGESSTDKTGDVISPTPVNSSSVVALEIPNTQLVEWKSGNEIATHSIAGPRIINFWASWCTPCREEMPLLAEEFTAEEIVGINSSDAGQSSFARSAAQSVLDETQVSYPIYIDADDKLVHELGIVAFPVTIVIDTHYKIVKRIDGPITEKNVEQIRTALEAAR